MILLIDGRSGSGKTELTTAITAGTDLQCVHLDALYPGFDGLAAGSAAVVRLLTEHRWQRWDWARNEPAEWHEIDPSRSLIIEGCGAISGASIALVDAAVWVDYPTAGRRKRALRREPSFAVRWEDWAAQELAHIAHERPRELATQIIDGENVAESAAHWRALLENS